MTNTITPRPVVASLFVSLDGYASDAPREDMRWVTDSFGDDVATFALERMQAMHTLVLGRVTYEIMAAYWPTATGAFAERMNAIPKVVVSRTLDPARLRWANTRVAAGDLRDEVAALRGEADRDIGVSGSVELVRSLMKLGLLDRLELHVHPVILGPAGGKPVFDGYDSDDLELVDTTVLDGRVVVLDYRPLGREPTWVRS